MNDKKCAEFEKSGWTLNPKTGRKINPTGRVAKKLREECGFTNTPQKPPRSQRPRPTKEQCDAIRTRPGVNPLTKRVIRVGGPTHRALLKKCAEDSVVRRIERSPSKCSNALRSSSPSPKLAFASARACEDKGFMQRGMTCWFNSTLNALCMGVFTGAHIQRVIESLPRSVQKGFETSGDRETCPLKPGKSHVLKYAYRYYAGLEHLMTPTTKNRPMSAIRAVMETPERLSIEKIGTGGYFSQKATKPILGAFFEPKEYAITTWRNVNKAATRDTRIIAFQEPNRGARYYELRDALKPRTKPKTLSADNLKFELSSAVLTIGFENRLAHAVALFRCGGKDYMYDSNISRAVRLKWSDGLNAESERKLRAFYELSLIHI